MNTCTEYVSTDVCVCVYIRNVSARGYDIEHATCRRLSILPYIYVTKSKTNDLDIEKPFRRRRVSWHETIVREKQSSANPMDFIDVIKVCICLQLRTILMTWLESQLT